MEAALIAQISLEVLKGFNRERRLAFSKRWDKVLKRVEDAANAHYPEYTDAELALAKEEEKRFYEAFLAEIKFHNSKRGGGDKDN